MVESHYDFFLSHPSAEKPRARQLYGALANAHSVFLDEQGVPLGASFSEVIRSAQLNSAITVLLVSQHSKQAFYQGEELVIGIELARANPLKHKVIPVYLDGRPGVTEWNFFGIHVLQSVDLQKVGDFNAVADLLSTVIKTRKDPRVENRHEHLIEHPLHKFRRDAFVDGDLIPKSLFDEFGKRFSSLVDQQLIIRDANSYRKQADQNDPTVKLIQPHRIAPAMYSSSYDYWFYVFEQARIIGARMLAALVLSVPDIGFEEDSRTQRRAMLESIAVL